MWKPVMETENVEFYLLKLAQDWESPEYFSPGPYQPIPGYP